MHSPYCGGWNRGRVGIVPHLRPGGCTSFLRWFAPFALVCSLTITSAAQGTGGVDCTDPLLATTTACSNASSLESQLPFQIPSPATPSSATSVNGVGNPNAPGALPANYSDIEQLSRQPVQPATPLPPEPLTEFQKFVASTTGTVLPVYGANLFRGAPSTFAPVDLAPVPADYVIGPGDELRIRIWGQVSLQSNVRVDRSGEIYLPQVGQIHVAGLAFSDLDAHLRQAVGRVYHNFDLTVDVGQIRAIQIYVTGAARRPGVYTVSSLSTLVDSIFASGGPSVEGSLRAIELRRGGAVVTRFDLYDLLIRGDKTKDAKLLGGDVIYIPPVGPQAAVYGSVRSPAIYELLPDEPLSAVLADAGGVSAVASEARVSIERIDEHRDRHAMEAAYDAAGLSMPLADGDTVRVYSIVPRYEKTVTLRGNIANPGRFAWHQGMRISELIPDKDSLLTRNYWWRRAQLGLPAPEFEPIPGLSSLRQPAENQPISIRQDVSGTNQIGTGSTSQTPGEGIPLSVEMPSAGNIEGPSQQSLQNSYGSQSPSNFSGLSARQRAGSAPLASQEVANPSQVGLGVERTDVRITAPEIDWDYAVIERLDPETLKNQLISFDLGRLVLQHDPTQDLELQPGDVISIFSDADIKIPVAKQTKFVRLEGEFVHSGVYSVEPGETLRHLVERAGGLTTNAYLYASEFTRVSTRAVQQARIDEYVQTLSLAIQRNMVNLASSAAAQQLAAGTAAQGSEQSLLASLRQIRATGRIVLPLRPSSSGVDSLPNLALEDGDSLVVPHVPSTVNVVGAVYDQNSFLYTDDTRAGTYLRQAGGLNRDADRRHEFVIRADGEVVSRDSSREPWESEFNNLRINPGDTIVVPEKILKPSPLYGLINWSQLFSQFALGAAALDVIH
jgi:protein involved in polysaccharide export with SLBB domain